MKKILSILCFALLACGTMQAALSGKKIYIDPGHGTYTGDDRMMNTIGIPYTAVKDGYGFAESHTNLWKSEEVTKRLQAAGATVKMSRTKNGVSPGLSTRATEAQNFGADYFLSIHSNAGTLTSNYPALFYKGKGTGTWVNGDSPNRCKKLWPWVWEIFEKGFETKSYYSATQMCIYADVDFWKGDYGVTTINGTTYYGYYGVLRHGRPGLLSEGYFHTVQPSRQRALNADYCRQEGIRYYRALASYYSQTADTKGQIMGMVKNSGKIMTNATNDNQLSASCWGYKAGSPDQYAPVNGAKVFLFNSNKQKIKEYTCDKYYNGVFVFYDLAPGTYYLDIQASGMASLTESQRKVVVAANATTYPIIKMTAGTYVADPNYNTGGSVVNPDPETPTTGITVTPNTEVVMSATVGQTTAAPYKDVKVVGTGLTSAMSVNSNTGSLTVTKLSGWDDLTGGTLRLTVNVNFSKGAGTYDSFVAIQSTSAYRVELPVLITLNPAAGTTDPGTNPNPGTTPETGTPDATYGNVKFYLQGGKIDVPADNEALWELFKPAYNTYTGENRADQAIANVATFAQAGTVDFMTKADSPWKWLGDYILSVTTAAERNLDTPVLWRFGVQAFFNKSAAVASTYNGNADFTTAGKPEAWQPLYTFAHKPTKSGATFLGWFNNANGTGSALTSCPSSGNVYACWSGGTTAIETLENTSAYLLPTFNGVEIFFEGTALVSIYSANGTMISNGLATDYYTCDLQSGMYIIRVGNEVFKFVR